MSNMATYGRSISISEAVLYKNGEKLLLFNLIDKISKASKLSSMLPDSLDGTNNESK